MSPASIPLRRLPAPRIARRRSRLERVRVRLGDGARTTVHLASYELAAYRPRVVVLDRPAPLLHFCRERRVRHAIVGGFFARPQYHPLGELWLEGRAQPTVPFASPWHGVRACVQTDGRGTIRIARRDELDARPRGDLLQAGPLLVRGGSNALLDGDDLEGFSAGSAQFDSDITDGRYPRAALALVEDRLVTVACDGRTHDDAGMTLTELADTLIGLGATDALNLDGGGSASLVYGGRLRNRPREEHGVDLLGGRPIVTAVAFEPR